MNIDLSKYLSTEPPTSRPFEVSKDVHLLDDFMTEVRRMNFVTADRPAMMEFITVDYDLVRIIDLLSPEPQEAIVMHLVINTPAGRQRFNSKIVHGVDADGNLWFADYGGFITANNEIALKKAHQAAVKEMLGDDFLEQMLKRLREGHKPPPDDGDWWKHGGPDDN